MNKIEILEDRIESLDNLYIPVEALMRHLDDDFSDMMVALEEDEDADAETAVFLRTAKALMAHVDALITEIEMKDTDEVPF